MKLPLKWIWAAALVACGCAVPLAQLDQGEPTASFVLQVMPTDAKVFLDGRYVGSADRFDGDPGTLAVTVGGHVLRFEHENFQNETVEIVAGRQPTVLDIEMLPKPRPPEKTEE